MHSLLQVNFNNISALLNGGMNGLSSKLKLKSFKTKNNGGNPFSKLGTVFPTNRSGVGQKTGSREATVRFEVSRLPEALADWQS
jgi:hypothetical protein